MELLSIFKSKEKIKSLFLNGKRNYLVGTQVINAVIGIASGKLIAEFFLPEEFGLYSLQFAVFTFFFGLLIGPTLRFIKSTYYTIISKIGFKYYIWTILLLTATLYGVLFLFFTFFRPEVNLNFYFFGILFLLVPANTISTLLLDQFNVKNQIRKYSTRSVIKAVSGLVFLICAVLIFHETSNSSNVLWLMQLVMGLSGISLISDFKFEIKETVISYSTFLKRHFKFTTPLMFMAFWAWISNYFDRFVIEEFMELKDVGVYNANYSLGSRFFLLINPIFLVMLTPYVYQSNSKQFKKKIIQKYSLSYLAFGTVLLIFIYFFYDMIGETFLSTNYKDGFFVIFWIAMSYLIMTATYQYESIFYYEQKTKFILFSNIISALVGIILNFVLIPAHGLLGAVVSTFVSILVRFLIVYFKFLKL